jgi:hypothetical protein
MAPNHKHKIRTVELYSIKGEQRISKYTPAVHLCWLFPIQNYNNLVLQ